MTLDGASPGKVDVSRRYFFAVEIDAPTDDCGLLDEARIDSYQFGGQAFLLKDLASQRMTPRCILVIGPPHAGKSFTIESLRKWLPHQPNAPRVVHTDIRTLGFGVEPAGWNAWRNSNEQAIWFIDSLDEVIQGKSTVDSINQLLADLPAEQRNRLRVLITCRENEVPFGLVDELRRAMNETPLTLRIAPPDKLAAAEICADGNLEHALSLIRQHALQEVAAHPAALKWLASRVSASVPPSAQDVWRGVIEALLEDSMRKHSKPQTPLTARFAAAARLAFILEFGELNGVTLDGVAGPSAPRLDALLEATQTVELNAVREAVRSPLFRSIGDVTRIPSRHLREWLAGWQLKELVSSERAEQVRELLGEVTDDGWVGSTVARLLQKLALPVDLEILQPWLRQQFEMDAQAKDAILDELLRTVGAAPGPISESPILAVLLNRWSRAALERALAKLEQSLSQQTNTAQRFALTIAEKLHSRSLLAFARLTLGSDVVDENVRYDALTYLESLDDQVDYRALVLRLRAQPPTPRQKLLSHSLVVALRKGVVSVAEAFEWSPKPDPLLGDSRTMLLLEIRKHLDVDTAFRVLESISESRQYDYDLPKKAVERLAQEQILSSERVFDAILNASRQSRHKQRQAWRMLLGKRQDLRQALYSKSEGLTEHEALDFRIELRIEDVDWLLSGFEAQTLPSARIVQDLARIAQQLPELKRLEILTRLENRAPSEMQRLRDAEADWKRQEREIEESMRGEAEEQLELGALLEQQLSRSFGSPEEELQVLGWLAFGGAYLRPSNVEGTLEELPEDLQAKAYARLDALVREATPTSVSNEKEKLRAIRMEGEAVEAAIRHFGVSHFNSVTLLKWLPILLRQLENDDVVGAIAEVAPQDSVPAFADAIRSEMEQGDYSHVAEHAPAHLWREGLTQRVGDLLQFTVLPTVGRVGLLQLCNRRAPETAASVARSWLSVPTNEVALRVAAIRVMLVSDPSFALEQLAAETAARGKNALLDVVGEFDRWNNGDGGVSVAKWDEPLVIQLAEMLFAHFPESADPHHQGSHAVSPTDEALDVRVACVRRLFDLWRIGSVSAEESLRKLAVGAPLVAARVQYQEAEMRAAQIVQPSTGSDGGGSALTSSEAEGGQAVGVRRARGRLPVTYLLRLLRDAQFRVPRTTAELFRVLVEVLRGIESRNELRQDLQLFLSRGEEGHVLEAALQTYVFRRLADLLPGNIIDRESWVPTDKRVDVLVRTPNGEQCSVPIEIKWSDDGRTQNAASSQLGASYIRGAGRTHGVYLVAWCGSTKPKSIGDVELKRLIAADIASYQSNNAGHAIEVVWWNLAPT